MNSQELADELYALDWTIGNVFIALKGACVRIELYRPLFDVSNRLQKLSRELRAEKGNSRPRKKGATP